MPADCFQCSQELLSKYCWNWCSHSRVIYSQQQTVFQRSQELLSQYCWNWCSHSRSTYSQQQTVFRVHKSCCHNTAETGAHDHIRLTPNIRLFSAFTRAVVTILLKLVFTFMPYLIQAVDCFQRSQNAVIKILLNSKFTLTTAQQNSQELLSKYCSTSADIHSTLQASLSIALPPNLAVTGLATDGISYLHTAVC